MADQPEGLFRLISETTTNDPNALNGGVTYTWDEVGNRTSRTSTLPPAAGVTNQTYNGLYDSNDQFTNHTFDNNGSTTNADGRTYTYDSRRRITRIQGTGLEVAYQYDSDGNLLKKTNNLTNEITKYVFDTQNATGYSQTLEEIVNGTPKVRYAYGSRLISRAEFDGSQWHRKFYHFDGEGNVAFLTDETGAITDRYTYADGRVIRHDGTSTNEFLMKGERVDKDTGLVFLRARWMNPEYQRFMTMDKFEGEKDDPLSRNFYLFGNGDIVNNSDPSGNVSLVEFAVSSAVLAVVSSVWPENAHAMFDPSGAHFDAQVEGEKHLIEAKQLALQAIVDVKNNPQKFIKWFGLPASTARENLVAQGYSKMFGLSYPVNFAWAREGGLDRGEPFAFVSPVDPPNTIHLTNRWYGQSDFGFSSRPGILVHELSHMLLRTGDYKPGREPEEYISLAHDDPDTAINNAYNWGHFAEDTEE